MAEFSVWQLVGQFRALGVQQGGVLLVHTSLRAVGKVEGGPVGLITALRIAAGREGTIVMATMTDGETLFDPQTTPTSGMGATAEAFWRQPGVVRSPHPFASFAAAGRLAERVCAPHPLAPPHGPDSPVGRVHDLGGQILLIGVTHSENTTLHLAESLAGVPYAVLNPCVLSVNGQSCTVQVPETDHCCKRFRLADDWLREAGEQREGKLGNADARIMKARDAVTAAVHHLTQDPLLFLCAVDQGCAECDRARASIDADWRTTPSRVFQRPEG
jgi:aminoglycoside 3-N-acetyltransferase